MRPVSAELAAEVVVAMEVVKATGVAVATGVLKTQRAQESRCIEVVKSRLLVVGRTVVVQRLQMRPYRYRPLSRHGISTALGCRSRLVRLSMKGYDYLWGAESIRGRIAIFTGARVTGTVFEGGKLTPL